MEKPGDIVVISRQIGAAWWLGCYMTCAAHALYPPAANRNPACADVIPSWAREEDAGQ